MCDQPGEALALSELGWWAYLQSDFKQAAAHSQAALELAGQVGDRRTAAASLYLMLLMSSLSNDLAAAKRYGEESMRLWRELDDPGSQAGSLLSLGYVAALQGEYQQAHAYLREGLAFRLQESNKLGVTITIQAAASLAFYQGRLPLAAQLMAGIKAFTMLFPTIFAPVFYQYFDKLLEALRSSLDPARFNAAWASGQGLTFTDLVAETVTFLENGPVEPAAANPVALVPPQKVVPVPAGSTPQPPFPDLPHPASGPDLDQTGLSKREQEVLRLLATGLSNNQIAEKLVLSPLYFDSDLR
jgi:hypothetical protein